MSEELKPCPFCDGEATLSFESEGARFAVYCFNGDCEVQPGTMSHETKKAARTAWNGNRLSSPRVEEVRREAFEEAAAIAEQPYSDAVMAFGPDEPFAVGRKIAAAIRSLSPTMARQPIHQRSGPHK